MCGEGLDEREFRETIFRLWGEGEAVFFLDVGRCVSDSEARVSSWITVCGAKGEEGWFE